MSFFPDVERITWAVCGTEWELVEDLTSNDGGVQIVRLNLTRANQENMLGSDITCQPGTTQTRTAPAQSYTTSPGHFDVQVQAAVGTRIDSFTKL